MIGLETARLAKTVGFDEPVMLAYNYERIGSPNMELNDFYPPQPVNDNPLCIAVPTQSELQKWFREKHGIYVLVEETWTFTHIGFYVKILKPDLFTDELEQLYYSPQFFATYEEALEDGLQEACRHLL